MKLTANLLLATLLACEASALAAAASPPTVDCQSRDFYGIPFSLTYENIGSLKLPYTVGSQTAEGVTSPTATFSVDGSISITAIFDRRGRMVELGTSSSAAKDPRGLRVGSSLIEVQKAWPEGKLYYGTSEEGRPYAIYLTGQTLALECRQRLRAAPLTNEKSSG